MRDLAGMGRAFTTVAVRISQPGPAGVLCSLMSQIAYDERGREQQKCLSVDEEDENTEGDV